MTVTVTDTLNAYQLAGRADCASPDSADSPGAEWLLLVATSADEILDYDSEAQDVDDLRDAITESADQLVPIYTYQKWQVFTDLAAWQEEVDEFGPIEDMDRAASIALYLIAERLLTTLVEDAMADRTEREDDER